MKKSFYVSLLLVFVLCSCSKEDEFINSSLLANQDFELVNLNDFFDTNSAFRVSGQKEQVAIRFRDEFAYEKTIKKTANNV